VLAISVLRTALLTGAAIEMFNEILNGAAGPTISFPRVNHDATTKTRAPYQTMVFILLIIRKRVNHIDT
jgi:hypothetical protein